MKYSVILSALVPSMCRNVGPWKKLELINVGYPRHLSDSKEIRLLLTRTGSDA